MVQRAVFSWWSITVCFELAGNVCWSSSDLDDELLDEMFTDGRRATKALDAFIVLISAEN